MTWSRNGWKTLPLCWSCWDKFTDGKKPARVTVDIDVESCVWCGERTKDGIYIRGHLQLGDREALGDERSQK